MDLSDILLWWHYFHTIFWKCVK